jgi:subtilisin family serine protease
MRRWKAGARLLVLGAALALPAGAVGAGEQPLPAGPPTTPRDAGSLDRIIVEYDAGTTSGERASARDDAGTDLVRTLGRTAFQLVRPEAGQSVADALASLRDDPNVRVAERDSFSVLHATTNDPLFGQLWGLLNTGLGIDGFAGAVAGADAKVAAAWDRTRGSSGVVIADLDSGYRFDAPDLAPVAWTNPADPADGGDNDGNGIVDDTHGADFVGSSADSPTTDGDPTDDNLIDGGHGVHTAGTMGAAGNNGIGISGVAQDVRIMPLRVCAYAPSVRETRCPTSSQIAAINYAGAHGARAANMSLGGTTFNAALRDAFAHNPGTLFVISAGNDAQDNDPAGRPHYPCAYDPSTSGIAGSIDNVVCVAATDQADGLASFSDFGATTVDLGAPGTEILSTYPATDDDFADGFETNDFASRWTNASPGFGRAGVGDGPLTSFGITDSPAATPAASSFHQVTLTTGVSIPAGSGACTLSGSRFLSLGADGAFSYYLIPSVGGSVSFTGIRSTAGSAMAPFSTVPVTGLAGTTVRVRFEYTAPSSPTAANGAWIDDLTLTCNSPITTPPTYGFLDGTSMAAPHVTGAAGLLFSLNPAASVAQVRAALLATVDPLASLTGRTVTGGRIDAAAALDEIRLPDTGIASGPPRSTGATHATFTFARSDAAIAGGFQCQLDGGAFAPCASPATYSVSGGGHTFAVRAVSPHGVVVDPTPAIASWTVLQCKVPKLRGTSLRRAKAALRRAHCALGRVRKPRARRGHRLPPLVVKSSKPGANATGAAGMRVALTLGPKPRARRRHHRRR